MLLPPVTMTVFALSGSVLPSGSWAPLVIVQSLIARHLEPDVARAYAQIVSKRHFVESYRALLKVAEDMPLTSQLILQLKQRLAASGAKPSVELARLELWASLFEVRAQGLVHLFANLFLLWDLNVLLQLERWAVRAGTRTRGWLEVIGEIEALASLATARALDPTTTFPEIVDGKEALVAIGLGHPLIAEENRVRNDVTLAGPGTALVITGSNMAGKSTLLRAIGVNVAMAFAGGPVCARTMRVPILRMRASMRIADSLQHGASYFQAELSRLRTVIAEAESSPPILFLLDELLRGTNARARHRGARAVVLHLLARHATGLVATHDIALSELEEELDGRVKNFHFTDVLAPDGEMIFDYRLREGVVKTSNALRLLAMAGVEVEADDKVRD
jgi:DNA mismatch repair ATPase MutS